MTDGYRIKRRLVAIDDPGLPLRPVDVDRMRSFGIMADDPLIAAGWRLYRVAESNLYRWIKTDGTRDPTTAPGGEFLTGTLRTVWSDHQSALCDRIEDLAERNRRTRTEEGAGAERCLVVGPGQDLGYDVSEVSLTATAREDGRPFPDVWARVTTPSSGSFLVSAGYRSEAWDTPRGSPVGHNVVDIIDEALYEFSGKAVWHATSEVASARLIHQDVGRRIKGVST